MSPPPPPGTPPIKTFIFYIVGYIDQAAGIVSISLPITIQAYTDTSEAPLPCLGNTLASPYPSGIEAGLALNTNSPSSDNNAGMIQILISSTVTITPAITDCPVSEIAVLNTTAPYGTLPFTEAATSVFTILTIAPPTDVAFGWNQYIPMCS